MNRVVLGARDDIYRRDLNQHHRGRAAASQQLPIRMQTDADPLFGFIKSFSRKCGQSRQKITGQLVGAQISFYCDDWHFVLCHGGELETDRLTTTAVLNRLPRCTATENLGKLKDTRSFSDLGNRRLDFGSDKYLARFASMPK